MYYEFLQKFRDALLNYGLWDQVRVDHEREFYLSLYIQDHLRQSYWASNVTPQYQLMYS